MAFAYATSLSNSPDQWGKMTLTDSKIGKGTADTDPSRVFCAINLFNQSEVYRYGTGNEYCRDLRKGNNGWRDEPGMFTALLSLLIGYMSTADAIHSQGFGKRPEYSKCKVNVAGSTFDDQTRPVSFGKRDQDKSMSWNDPWGIESIEMLDEEDEAPLWDDVDWANMFNPGNTKFGHAADSN
ncbi:hypothetical protein N7478_013253 [Penicillium angulare]|uniref:uncharacterized protein n=1 Tax=Penicillium angulare TaxID=116970 RepID=UPI002541F246|nr:uncharacterized protein N7478_013253 [Penicillium angulare]KAJ5257149.1 hypothetical protein N7478_013253 [Penicillium angulare]